jgi:Xaa-Pro aminopeptidase
MEYPRIPDNEFRTRWERLQVEFESPIFGPGNHDPLEADMVLSIDVPLFHAPWGGLRYEDGFLHRNRRAGAG